MKDIQQSEFCAIHTLLSIQGVSNFESFFLIFIDCNQLLVHLLERKVKSRILSISCIQVTKLQNLYYYIMPSRQLHSKDASDGQSLPERTRTTKKSTDQQDQQTMDQQSSLQSEQRRRPESAQQPAGETATSATNPTPGAESMLLHITGLPQMPTVQVGLLTRTSSPQVQLPATQTSSSRISPMSDLSLWKTGSTPVAVTRRCVTEKLQP